MFRLRTPRSELEQEGGPVVERSSRANQKKLCNRLTPRSWRLFDRTDLYICFSFHLITIKYISQIKIIIKYVITSGAERTRNASALGEQINKEPETKLGRLAVLA